jgi:predicted O-methyltransferase YrrM
MGVMNMRPNSDLQRFRNDFVRNFQRIGLNTTPGDAGLLRILVESSGAKQGLEIGVATGYGAIVMGLGFERNGGRLTSVDSDGAMVKTARANLRKMRLQEVAVVKGAALEVIPKLDGPLDFVFIDAAKTEYQDYLRAVEPKLKAGAVIVADNVIKFAEEMRDFLDAVQNDPNYQMVVIRASEEKGDGMAVIYRTRDFISSSAAAAGPARERRPGARGSRPAPATPCRTRGRGRGTRR